MNILKKIIAKTFNEINYFFRQGRKINLIKTVYLNFRKLPFKQAYKLPIVLYGKVSLVSLKGKIRINSKVYHGMIKINLSNDMLYNPKANTIFNIKGIIEFNGPVNFINGTILTVYDTGKLVFTGNNHFGANLRIICRNNILIGAYTRSAFDCILMDTGIHYTINTVNNKINNTDGNINIGSYNWLTNRVTVMKNTKTPNNVIIMSGSILNKDYLESVPEYSIIGGNPIKLIRENISRVWNPNTESIIKDYFHNGLNGREIENISIK